MQWDVRTEEVLINNFVKTFTSFSLPLKTYLDQDLASGSGSGSGWGLVQYSSVCVLVNPFGTSPHEQAVS